MAVQAAMSGPAAPPSLAGRASADDMVVVPSLALEPSDVWGGRGPPNTRVPVFFPTLPFTQTVPHES
eukprot:scaffold103397_cov66-Phaeocystis_antarctica.AAC.5